MLLPCSKRPGRPRCGRLGSLRLGLTAAALLIASAAAAQTVTLDLGDTIAVVNPQSNKILQAQIVAPGKVSVSAPLLGRIAANIAPAQP